MRSKFETTFLTRNDEGTTYWLRPNPDADGGFAAGAVLEWQDPGDKDWSGHFFIAPDSLEAISEMFAEAERLRKQGN